MKNLILFFLATILGTISYAQPTLNTPDEGASDLEAAFTIGIGTFAGASTYDIEISDDGSFTGVHPAYQASLASTSRSMVATELNYGGTYSIRWRSDNSAYGTTTVTVKSSPETWAQITNGSTLSSSTNITPRHQYLVSDYDWEFDTTASFSSLALISANTDATVNQGRYSYDPNNFLAGYTYYVRVRGNVSSQSLTGDWSTDVRNFNTSLRNAPTLNTPEEGATDMNLSFNIGIGTVTGASTYDIEISENGLFNDTPPAYQGQVGSASRSFSVSGLSENTTYTLRWRSNNSEYGTTTITTYSDITTSTTIADGAYLNTQSANLPLTVISGATSYDWEFDTINTFDSPALIQSTVSSGTNNGFYPYVADNFLSGEQYFCRISINGVGSGGFGPIKNFYASLHIPDMLEPANGQVMNRTSMKLECENVSNATTFEIEYADNAAFVNSTTVTTNYDYYNPGGWNNPGEGGEIIIRAYNWVSGLDYNQEYYVRTRASNGNQAGNWNSTTSFNTGSPTLGITSPADGATNVSTTVYVRCNSLHSSASLYQFQVDDDIAFGSPTSQIASVNGSRFTSLDPGTTYYARVRALGGNWTDFSASTSFTTVSGAKQGDQEIGLSQESIETNIYPNPSNDVFYLVTENESKVTISNISGQIVDAFDAESGINTFGTNLKEGVYVVFIQSANGVTTQRIVKH